MGADSQYLTRAEFARSQGWSRSYVTKLGQQGRLVLDPDGKLIDIGATVALLRRTTDPGKESIRQHHAAARGSGHVEPPADAPPASAGADPKYWDNKARREGALAELAELELGKKRGELVELARVESASFATARMFRDTLLGLPTQLAPVFATMTDAFEIEVKLRDALRQACADFAKMKLQDLALVAEQSH